MPGERILWRGEPAGGIRFVAADLFAIPFAALWLALVSGAFVSDPAPAANNDPAGDFILPVFIAIGVYILVGRFFVDMLIRSRSEYVLTDRRAVIESGLLFRSKRSANLAATPEIRLRGGTRGRGSVEFGSGSPFAMMPRSWPGMSRYLPPAFEMIDDAESVYTLALDAQHRAQSAR